MSDVKPSAPRAWPKQTDGPPPEWALHEAEYAVFLSDDKALIKSVALHLAAAYARGREDAARVVRSLAQTCPWIDLASAEHKIRAGGA